jgi:hypothetical protein
MTVQVRNSVFETNSSSSHSVTISQDELADLKVAKSILREGVIKAKLQGFGWEWERFYSPGVKIAYLIAQMAPAEARGAGKDVTSMVRRNDRVGALLDLIEKKTGCRVEVIGARDPYVDHNSVGTGIELLEDQDQLLKFIFGERSFLETGNDNSSPPRTIKTDLGGDESYHEHRISSVHDDSERFAMTIDFYGGNVFMQREGGEPIYANIDDHVDMSSFLTDLDGMVIERFEVWSQRPKSVSEEDAADDVREFVHEYLIGLAYRLPAVKIVRDLVIDCTFDVTVQDLSLWDRQSGASITIHAAADLEKAARLSAMLERHSGVTVAKP